MGAIRKHQPVKLFVGFIYKDDEVPARAQKVLSLRYGAVDVSSPVFPFHHTTYYEREFGIGLKRRFVAFERLVAAESLADVKLRANALERKYAAGPARAINIDPGYLTLAKVVLATTKDFTHRLYIGKSIFAEVTLAYRDKGYKPWEWTYPDYSSKEYLDFFHQLRSRYAGQIK